MSSSASQPIVEAPSVEVTPKVELTERQRQFAESPHLQALCAWAETSAASFPVDSAVGIYDVMFDVIHDHTDLEWPENFKEELSERRDMICDKIRNNAVWITSLKLDPAKVVEFFNEPEVQKLDESGQSKTDRLIENLELVLQVLKIGKLEPSERKLHIERWKAAHQLRAQKECEKILYKAVQAQLQAAEESKEESKEEVQDNPLPQ